MISRYITEGVLRLNKLCFSCLYDTECEKEHKASGKQQDYSDQYKDKDWLGFEQLNAQTFREKV